MDNKTPEGDALARPLKPARVALNVLALCFTLALDRPRPRRELYGFPETDRGEFRLGPRPGGLGLFADLAGGRADGAGGRPAVRPLRPPHRLFAGTAAARRRVPVGVAGASAVAIPVEHQASAVGIGIAFIGNVPNSILLGRWFGPRLPTAMAVVYSATGAGVLVLLPASQLLIDHVGWRGAYQIFGIVALWPAGAVAAAAVAAVLHGLAAHRQKSRSRFRRRGLDARERHAPPRILGAVCDLLLHGGGDVCACRADRRLSDRRRLSAAAGGDRLGLFRRRAAVRHAGRDPTRQRSSDDGRRCCSATPSRF